ncbi:hypothetical protein, partial [Staphylococcus aureus]|uniref:hypothetical protein n=1 Tax=Staphylococcus aureus TaxID=1280 RepID=UPI0038B31FD8
DGRMKEDKLRHDLTTFGEKLTSDEMDDALSEAPITKGYIDIKKFTALLTGSAKDEEEGA